MYSVRVVSKWTGKTITRKRFPFLIQVWLCRLQWMLTPILVRFIVKRE